MKEERKKVERNLVGSITPKKREEPIEPIVKETPTESKTSVKSKTEPKQEPETPKTVLKFVKVCDAIILVFLLLPLFLIIEVK